MNSPAAELTDTLLASLTEMNTAPTAPTIEVVKAETEAEEEASNHYSAGVTSAIEEKALTLLGAGVPSESVASALGVTAGRISQLLSNKLFANRVSKLRYEALQKHNARDIKYDSLEDRLLERLDRRLPLLIKPESILKALSIVNGAKRRGQSNPDQASSQQKVVNIILPNITAQKFTINLDNQVTKAGSQELLTISSGNLLRDVEEATENRLRLEQLEQLEQEEEQPNVLQEERGLI